MMACRRHQAKLLLLIVFEELAITNQLSTSTAVTEYSSDTDETITLLVYILGGLVGAALLCVCVLCVVGLYVRYQRHQAEWIIKHHTADVDDSKVHPRLRQRPKSLFDSKHDIAPPSENYFKGNNNHILFLTQQREPDESESGANDNSTIFIPIPGTEDDEQIEETSGSVDSPKDAETIC